MSTLGVGTLFFSFFGLIGYVVSPEYGPPIAIGFAFLIMAAAETAIYLDNPRG